MSWLVICEILGLLVNTLIADDKYSVHYKENLQKPIQMQLSKNQKTFSQVVAAFLKFTSIFQHFEKKDDLHSLCISEITDCKRRG